MLDQLPVVALDVILSKLDFYSKLAVYSTSKELRMNVLGMGLMNIFKPFIIENHFLLELHIW